MIEFSGCFPRAVWTVVGGLALGAASDLQAVTDAADLSATITYENWGIRHSNADGFLRTMLTFSMVTVFIHVCILCE
jgi:hypothetical protein